MKAESQNGMTGVERQWNYCTALQFFAREINQALIDCKCALGVAPISHGALVAVMLPGVDATAVPTDDALLARDWIARSETPEDTTQHRYLSFAQCCGVLGVDTDRSRMNLLAAIDAASDYDTDECWERLKTLSAEELPDDDEPLFDAPRVVPVLDQVSLFTGAAQ